MNYRKLFIKIFPFFMNPIEKMQKDIANNIISLNYGGCGIFAYLMTYELRKRKVPCIIEYRDCCQAQEKNLIYLNNRNARSKISNITGNHFWVSTPYINFDGYSKVEEDKTGSYSLNQMRFSLAKGGWNNDYNKNQNRELYSIIKKHIDLISVYLNNLYEIQKTQS